MGAEEATLKAWCKLVGWETLVNRRGTSWRKLSDSEHSDLTETRAIGLMIANPSLIKRPVITVDETVMVGFDETEFAEKLL